MRARVDIQYVDKGVIESVEVYLDAPTLGDAEARVFELVRGQHAERAFDLRARWDIAGAVLQEDLNFRI